ncbi:hypothetical protein RvY_04064 [Ramazzottius varieornatus]|uniref:Uncharacterized protein n=1 Tax=Ramazzottius varieornatus TaxID=947166 RepID=A0A1D1UTU7_RAMVA|nr:hypothetical protein RvY_04064 [Ramazzottius varieornatus]
MCYRLERNGVGMIYDYNEAAATMDMALDYANHNILPSHLRLASVYRDIGNTCSAKTHIVEHALGLKDKGVFCTVYIGPGTIQKFFGDKTTNLSSGYLGCGSAAEVLNNLAEAWDIPIIDCHLREWDKPLQ